MAYLRPYLNIDGININWEILTMEKEATQSNEKMYLGGRSSSSPFIIIITFSPYWICTNCIVDIF